MTPRTFGISVMLLGMLENDRLHVTPETAARIDEGQFLEFASAVAKVARRIEQRRAQMELPLESK